MLGAVCPAVLAAPSGSACLWGASGAVWLPAMLLLGCLPRVRREGFCAVSKLADFLSGKSSEFWRAAVPARPCQGAEQHTLAPVGF